MLLRRAHPKSSQPFMTAARLLELAKDAGFALASVAENRFNLEDCRGLLVVGLVYGNIFAEQENPPALAARIAPFARRNYYRLAVQKLREIAGKLRRECGGIKADYRVYCNSRTVNEKQIAFQCGLADIGRNTLLLTREYGSLFVTGMLTLPFAPEHTRPLAGKKLFALCGQCDASSPPCHKACPTGAITGESRLETERCIQWYLSGHGETIPHAVQKNWNERLYGCTLCQDACGYNRKPIQGVHCGLGVLPAVMDAGKITAATDAELKKMFHGTAIGLSWLCPDGLRRNAAVCQGTYSETRA